MALGVFEDGIVVREVRRSGGMNGFYIFWQRRLAVRTTFLDR